MFTFVHRKGFLKYKAEKVNTAIEFCIFELVYVPNFSLNWQFWFLWPNLPKKGLSSLKQKSELHRKILHIQISLSTRFQLKLIILIFGPNLPKKGVSSLKHKMNSTIEFCIFELVEVPYFSLNWQFWFFGPNLPKMGVSVLKQKNWTAPLNSAYSN